MNSPRLPILLEDGSSLDWREASYKVKVTLQGTNARIEHRLTGSPGLQALLDGGTAAWVTEMRSPRTLLSRQMSGAAARQDVAWQDDEIVGDVFLLPGMIAVREAVLAPSEELDPDIWARETSLVFPAGSWIAKGELRSVKPLLMSLVRFRRDAGGCLKAGEMSVEEGSDGPAPCFYVDLAVDLYDRRLYDRDVQVAGLIAAFGWLPRSSLKLGGANAETRAADRLRAEFEARGIPDWNDESFDPAAAATAWEPFHVPHSQEDDDGD